MRYQPRWITAARSSLSTPRAIGFEQKLKVVGAHVETDGGLGVNSLPLWWRASFASLTPVFAPSPGYSPGLRRKCKSSTPNHYPII